MLVQQDKLSAVVHGMEIYNRDGTRIGTVKAFRLGEGTIKTNETDIVTISETLKETLGNVDLPTVLYSRLYDQGFVSYGRGFLRSDGIIFPEQIDRVANDAIHLNVHQDELYTV